MTPRRIYSIIDISADVNDVTNFPFVSTFLCYSFLSFTESAREPSSDRVILRNYTSRFTLYPMRTSLLEGQKLAAFSQCCHLFPAVGHKDLRQRCLKRSTSTHTQHGLHHKTE
jgi:hypothetical protein